MKFVDIPLSSSGVHTYFMDTGEYIYERAYPVSVYIVCINGTSKVSSSVKASKILESGKILRIPPNTPHKITSMDNGITVLVLFE